MDTMENWINALVSMVLLRDCCFILFCFSRDKEDSKMGAQVGGEFSALMFETLPLK